MLRLDGNRYEVSIRTRRTRFHWKARLSGAFTCAFAVLLSLLSNRAEAGWTAVATPPPGGGIANMALLTDGRVLVSGGDSTSTWSGWWTLSPDASGSYVNGTWARVGDSAWGHLFNPAFVLKDGSYWICGGEYVCPSSNLLNCGTQNGTWADCERFDPISNTWSSAPSMAAGGVSDGVYDVPSALTNAGIVILSADSSGNTFTYDPNAQAWSLDGTYSVSDIPGEGGSVLLPDGSVFAGAIRFDRYVGTSGLWHAVASTSTIPGGTDSNEFTTSSSGEIGPFVLLYSGLVLVLGENSRNGLYDYVHDSWSLADDTPAGPNPSTPYNHGDTPACVEPNGKVLTIVTDDQNGVGAHPGFFYEFDPSAAAGSQWTAIGYPAITSSKSGNPERTRMLALPKGNVSGLATGQILVSNLETNNTLWLYTPGTPAPSNAWKPTITSTPFSMFGTFVMSGTQLAGLTTGGDFGDDGKSATNFPIVSLWSSAGQVSFARTTVDSITPASGAAGTCWFTLPAGLASGTYAVHVSANGIDSSNTVNLTLPALDLGPALVATETALL